MSEEIDVKWPIITINLVVAVDILGLMLILPIIDVFSQHLGASKSEIGLQLTLYSVCAIISSFLVGRISDKFGRKTVFLLSALGSFVTSLGGIFITTFTQFLIISAFSGFFSGTIGTAYAYIGDIVYEEKRRSRYIAYITATISCCLVLGPLCGGLISSLINLRAPFVVSAVIACIEFFLVLRYLKNPSELLKSKQIRLVAGDISQYYDYAQKDSFNSEDIKSNRIFTELNYYHRTSFSEIILTDPQYTTGIEKNYRFPSSSSNATTNTLHSPLMSVVRSPEEKDSINLHETENLLATESQTPPIVTTSNNDDIAKKESSAKALSPWLDYRAIIVGGFGTFFNSFTYLGLVTIMPLILQEHKFNIVDDDNNTNNNQGDDDGDLSSSETARISFLMGVYLCCYGVVQVIGMIFVFPRLNRRLGLFKCGFIGCLIYGTIYCLTVIMDSYEQLFIIYICMAIGNSISRPTFPSYLGSIATKQNRADYMSISATFGNLSLMIAGQMTVLYTINRDLCLLICGGVSILNAFSMLLFGVFHNVPNNTK
eukprot:gene6359-6852_t